MIIIVYNKLLNIALYLMPEIRLFTQRIMNRVPYYVLLVLMRRYQAFNVSKLLNCESGGGESILLFYCSCDRQLRLG